MKPFFNLLEIRSNEVQPCSEILMDLFLRFQSVDSADKGQSSGSITGTIGFELGAKEIDPCHQKIQDQPFGLGVVDEGLCSYRKDCEGNTLVVDKDYEEEDVSPARLCTRRLQVWTSDLTNYLPKHFTHRERAIRCNLHGYLALPVFDSTAGSWICVFELLMSSEFTSYAFDVQQVHMALKSADLTSQQAFDCPAISVHNGHTQNELKNIFRTLKVVCGIHKVPLAQTWSVSLSSNFACHGEISKKILCQDHKMLRWSLPKRNKKAANVTDLKLSQKSWPEEQFQQSTNVLSSIHGVVFLLISVKRWSCSGKRHGFSGRWWSCGKHSYLPSKSDLIYHVACPIVQLRQWKNKISIRHALKNSTSKPKYTTNITNPYLHFDWQLPEPIHVHAFRKQTDNNRSDIRMVTMKATYKDNMIKFRFPTASGLLELENQVAQRINLLSRRFRLKYMDEDSDLILLACDADLRNLLRFSTSKSTIKLFITMVHD